MFTMADKSTFTVAIKEVDYENKMHLLLSYENNDIELNGNSLKEL